MGFWNALSDGEVKLDLNTTLVAQNAENLGFDLLRIEVSKIRLRHRKRLEKVVVQGFSSLAPKWQHPYFKCVTTILEVAFAEIRAVRVLFLYHNFMKTKYFLPNGFVHVVWFQWGSLETFNFENRNFSQRRNFINMWANTFNYEKLHGLKRRLDIYVTTENSNNAYYLFINTNTSIFVRTKRGNKGIL